MLSKLLLKLKTRKKDINLSYVEKRTPVWKPLLFLIPALVVLGFFTIYPFVLTIDKAFHPLANTHKAGTGEFGLSGFTDVMDNYYFKKSLSNSLIYAFVAIPIAIVIALLISSAIASVSRKWLRGIWQTIFFVPFIISGVVVPLTFSYMFGNETRFINNLFGWNTNWLEDPSGSNNALTVIIIEGIWSSLAFKILIFTTAMLAVDKQRYKAASIDGAGPIKQFFTITLPSINKTLGFIITISLIGAIKVNPLALFHMDATNAQLYGGTTLMLFVFKNISSGQYEAAGASALLLVVISIAFNLVVRNTFKLAGLLVMKGGEWNVQRKVKI